MSKEEDRAIAEVRAMSAAVRTADGQGDPNEIRLQIQEIFVKWQPSSPSERVVLCAMAKIVGEDCTQFIPNPYGESPVDNLWETEMTKRLSRIWALWACSRPAPEMAQEVAALKPPSTEEDSGAVHRMALEYWSSAITSLVVGDFQEARRLWRRAIEIGSNFGSDSHPIILWTYAATFFPT